MICSLYGIKKNNCTFTVKKKSSQEHGTLEQLMLGKVPTQIQSHGFSLEEVTENLGTRTL